MTTRASASVVASTRPEMSRSRRVWYWPSAALSATVRNTRPRVSKSLMPGVFACAVAFAAASSWSAPSPPLRRAAYHALDSTLSFSSKSSLRHGPNCTLV